MDKIKKEKYELIKLIGYIITIRNILFYQKNTLDELYKTLDDLQNKLIEIIEKIDKSDD